MDHFLCDFSPSQILSWNFILDLKLEANTATPFSLNFRAHFDPVHFSFSDWHFILTFFQSFSCFLILLVSAVSNWFYRAAKTFLTIIKPFLNALESSSRSTCLLKKLMMFV